MADPLTPDMLSNVHPLWAQDARQLAPWQEISTLWCSGCEVETWWRASLKTSGRVLVCGHCSSVLDVARPLAENGMLDPYDCVMAVSQWSGRGQLRRAWDSQPGNLYLALYLPPAPKEFDSLVPLAVGYSLAAFFRTKKLPVSIKWPNDLILNSAKIGGILVEERRGALLAGIGLNLAHEPRQKYLRDGHAVPCGRLRDAGFDATPLRLCADLVDFVKICYSTLLTQGSPGEAAALIEPFLCWLGQDVTVREDGEAPWTGRLLGLAPGGELRAKPAGGAGERLLTSGSIWREP
jgi:BirA family biotin operon repressor/biotin-[acetyl-CoA-carboxylase] ligase